MKPNPPIIMPAHSLSQMILYRAGATVLLVGLVTVGLAASPEPTRHILSFLVPKAFQANPSLDMTVYTEMTDYGRQLPEVSPEQPMIFLPYSVGFQAGGTPTAGERPPIPAELEQYMFKALETRGFRPATEGGNPPRLALIYYWGSNNTMDPDLAKNFPDLWRHETLQRAMLVGGQEFAKRVGVILDFGAGASDMAPEVQKLLVQASKDIYYVVVSAYSYEDLTKNERRLAWRTTMTVTANGVAMRTAMRPLVINAGDYFGRSTLQPVAIRRDVRSGTVTLGPLEVLDSPVSAAPPAQR